MQPLFGGLFGPIFGPESQKFGSGAHFLSPGTETKVVSKANLLWFRNTKFRLRSTFSEPRNRASAPKSPTFVRSFANKRIVRPGPVLGHQNSKFWLRSRLRARCQNCSPQVKARRVASHQGHFAEFTHAGSALLLDQGSVTQAYGVSSRRGQGPI